ncbi:2-amino-4-hydroxy-6-hydroxymethyldihydropteridine diphosphokinase [Castellaniella sp.]|uniref:2-amino-4-hydroxy-6- hydroxymethyldihydropteridine diphosphokinase n=1 Tax=Castellaniella sp. TaxID=1955812 RepID=UPI003567EAFB
MAASHPDRAGHVAPALHAFIGVGGNLGDPIRAVHQAADTLSQHPQVRALRLSPLYITAPVDSTGPAYVNAVMRIETTLMPHALLAVLQQIEQAHGRTRPWRNAPRTLDLDLLWYDGRHIHTPDLIVPHPRMHQRAFVLQPLQDLAPDLTLPQGPLAALLAQCRDQKIDRLAAPNDTQDPEFS